VARQLTAESIETKQSEGCHFRPPEEQRGAVCGKSFQGRNLVPGTLVGETIAWRSGITAKRMITSCPASGNAWSRSRRFGLYVLSVLERK